MHILVYLVYITRVFIENHFHRFYNVYFLCKFYYKFKIQYSYVSNMYTYTDIFKGDQHDSLMFICFLRPMLIALIDYDTIYTMDVHIRACVRIDILSY